MEIGIHSTALTRKRRTGVEEYSYQLIKSLLKLPEAKHHQFILYLPDKLNYRQIYVFDEFKTLAKSNLKIEKLKWRFPMWTQTRLSSEFVFRKPDIFFSPAHTLPLIHPENSIVTIHGLEYEHYPYYYSFWKRQYLKFTTLYALKYSKKIIAVSENTRNDLVELYDADPQKISVIYHGVKRPVWKRNLTRDYVGHPYILFIGRIEFKKNIFGLISAFYFLKKKYNIPHKLILIGPKGYGWSKIYTMKEYKSINSEIEFKGYVKERKKWELLKNADVFVLPSFYEGFGMPILEAQISSVPVVTSNVSSMPEIAGRGAVFVDPHNIYSIAEGIYSVISSEGLRKQLIEEGKKNAKKFSWNISAKKTFEVLTEIF